MQNSWHAYSKFSEIVDAIRNFTGIQHQKIGSACDGRSPLLAITSPIAPAPTSPWILISAGIHGDEKAGVLAAMEFMRRWMPLYIQRVNFVVLPCINPTGFDADTLENSRGVNLNRQFGVESLEPEIVAVEQWLAKFNGQFHMTFDLHEVLPNYVGEGFVESDNPRECYLYETQNDPSKRIGHMLIKSLRKLTPNIPVCEFPTIYHDINESGVVAYPEANRNAIYATGTSLDSFLNGRYTDHSFTTETPTGWPMELRVKTQIQWLKAAVEYLAKDDRVSKEIL